jgi:hypothetical protein
MATHSLPTRSRGTNGGGAVYDELEPEEGICQLPHLKAVLASMQQRSAPADFFIGWAVRAQLKP